MQSLQHTEQLLASAYISIDEFRQQAAQLREEAERLRKDHAGLFDAPLLPPIPAAAAALTRVLLSSQTWPRRTRWPSGSAPTTACSC